jgi:hypothetical protein
VDPITFAVWFGLMAASYLISAALAPKPTTPTPAAFQDFDFPQSVEGTPQAVIFGDVWSADWMVLAVGNYRTTEIKSGGGKK